MEKEMTKKNRKSAELCRLMDRIMLSTNKTENLLCMAYYWNFRHSKMVGYLYIPGIAIGCLGGGDLLLVYKAKIYNDFTLLAPCIFFRELLAAIGEFGETNVLVSKVKIEEKWRDYDSIINTSTNEGMFQLKSNRVILVMVHSNDPLAIFLHDSVYLV